MSPDDQGHRDAGAHDAPGSSPGATAVRSGGNGVRPHPGPQEATSDQAVGAQFRPWSDPARYAPRDGRPDPDPVELGRFEPTVFGAARRHLPTVAVTAVLTCLVAVVFTLVNPEQFRASAGITVPKPLALQAMDNAQYLDTQVLLLESEDVADRAARIANGALGSTVLGRDDFVGERARVEITPPEMANPGTYGVTLIQASFTWTDPRTAQAGLNALLQAFDDARDAAVRAEGEASLAGIERALRDPRTSDQEGDLTARRTLTLTNLQIDLAHHPSVRWASEPRTAVNGNVKRTAAIGLLLGCVLGCAIAYVRALRRPVLTTASDASVLYRAPVLAEVPPPPGERPPWRSAIPEDSAGAGPGAVAKPGAVAGDAGRVVALRFVASAVDHARGARSTGLSLAVVRRTSAAGSRVSAADLARALGERGRRVLVVSPGAAASAEGRDASAAPRGVLDRSTADHDVVIVDCPPLRSSAVATDWTGEAAACLVLVGEGDPVQDHRHAAAWLDLVQANVIGCVYERRSSRFRLPRFGRGPVGIRSGEHGNAAGDGP